MISRDKIKLFCLPFAGGSYYAYRGFETHISEFVNVAAIDISGHGNRFSEPLLTDIDKIVEDIFNQIRDNLDKPYAILGHSMGSVIGYLVLGMIVKNNLPQPVHMFMSGRGGPAVESIDKDMYLLPKDEFIVKVTQYGGMPKEILEQEELLEFFLPILRADFQAVGAYRYTPGNRYNIPITVLLGMEDKTTMEEALQWQEITTREIEVKKFPGGHFFIFEHVHEIGNLIIKTLKSYSS